MLATGITLGLAGGYTFGRNLQQPRKTKGNTNHSSRYNTSIR